MTANAHDIAELLPLMPNAVDLWWHQGSANQSAEGGAQILKPVLHFSLPLDDMDSARGFLREHGKDVACYKLDVRDKGLLMIGLTDDGEAKRIAREELDMEVPAEGVFGQRG